MPRARQRLSTHGAPLSTVLRSAALTTEHCRETRRAAGVCCVSSAPTKLSARHTQTHSRTLEHATSCLGYTHACSGTDDNRTASGGSSSFDPFDPSFRSSLRKAALPVRLWLSRRTGVYGLGKYGLRLGKYSYVLAQHYGQPKRLARTRLFGVGV